MNKTLFTGEWYPWYPEKALTSEAIDGLTLTEEAAYRRALDKAWLKGSLPADPKDAAKVIGKGCSVKVAARVLELFTPIQGNKKRVVNLPQERIRAEQAEKHQKAVERATKAANARHNRNGDVDATSTPQAIDKDAIKSESVDLDSFPNGKDSSHSMAGPVETYREFFPDASLSPYLQDLIEGRITDIPRWRQTLTFWKSNGYRAVSVGKMCDHYDEQAVKKNGNSKSNSGRQRSEPSEESTDDFLARLGSEPL